MTSDQLVAFVERKLEEHGIKKVVPDGEELAQAYRLGARSQEVGQIVHCELEKLNGNRRRPSPRLTSRTAFGSTCCCILRPAGTRPCSTWWQTHQN